MATLLITVHREKKRKKGKTRKKKRKKRRRRRKKKRRKRVKKVKRYSYSWFDSFDFWTQVNVKTAPARESEIRLVKCIERQSTHHDSQL